MFLAKEWEEFEEALGIRPQVSGTSVEELRGFANQAKAARGSIIESTTLDIETISLEDFRVRTYIPKVVRDPLALAIFIHGGGYCLNDLDTEEATARVIADCYPVAAVAVEYRLAPEHLWPTSLNDCMTATEWALHKFSTSAIVDTQRLLIIGGSAGGQLALSLTCKLLESGISVRGVGALCPVSIGQSMVPASLKARYKSMEENKDAPFLTRDIFQFMMNLNGHDEKDLRYSVLLSPTLRQFPPTYIVTCSADPLLDDGILLRDQLKLYGIPVRYDNYEGYPHYFWGVLHLKMTGTFNENLVKGVKFLLDT